MKLHLYNSQKNGWAACGRKWVQKSTNLYEVTCKSCQRTQAYTNKYQSSVEKFTRKLQTIRPYLENPCTYEAFVRDYDPDLKICYLKAVCTWNHHAIATDMILYDWHQTVYPGQHIWFWAQCYGLGENSKIPYLEFKYVIKTFHPQLVESRPDKIKPEWLLTSHALQRQAERGVPSDCIYFVLKHGIYWQEGNNLIFKMPKISESSKEFYPWRHLKIVTRGKKIITLYQDYRPLSCIPHMIYFRNAPLETSHSNRPWW